MGTLLRYESCPVCGSKDNLAIFTDGQYCYTPNCTNRKGEKHPDKYQRVEWPRGFRIKPIQSRRLTAKTCTKYGVQSKGKIIGFPYIYKGNLYAIKSRDFNYEKSNRQYHFHSFGAAPCTFFGWHAVNSNKIIAIAGGEFDAMSVEQLVRVPCVSPPEGDKSIIETVKFHLEDLLQFEEVVFIPDNDAVCHKAFREAASFLRKEQVKFVSLALADPSAYLTAPSAEYELFRKAFYSSESAIDSLLVGSIKANKTHVERIDNDIPFFNSALMGLRTGEVSILLGRTGQGKSTCSRWMALELAESGYKTGIFSLEESPAGYGESLDELFTANGMDVDRWVSMSSLHGTLKLKEFSSAFTALVKLRECKVIVLDNLTAAADPSNTNESLNQLMLEVNKLAADLNVHVICVSHTSRESEKAHAMRRLKGEEDLPPQIGDAFGSSFLEKFAWNFITIHVQRVGVTRFEILKARKGNLALPTVHELNFKKGRYH